MIEVVLVRSLTVHRRYDHDDESGPDGSSRGGVIEVGHEIMFSTSGGGGSSRMSGRGRLGNSSSASRVISGMPPHPLLPPRASTNHDNNSVESGTPSGGWWRDTSMIVTCPCRDQYPIRCLFFIKRSECSTGWIERDKSDVLHAELLGSGRNTSRGRRNQLPPGLPAMLENMIPPHLRPSRQSRGNQRDTQVAMPVWLTPVDTLHCSTIVSSSAFVEELRRHVKSREVKKRVDAAKRKMVKTPGDRRRRGRGERRRALRRVM